MIRLDLAPHEREILAELLKEALSDLRMPETVRGFGRATEDGLGQAEIAGTDSKDYREMPKTRKRVIHTTLDALGRPARPFGSRQAS